METEITIRLIARMIDHSLLHPALTDKQIREGCAIARRFSVATACVKPYAIAMVRHALEGSDVGVCAVAGFPHGNSTTTVKLEECRQAVAAGASEIDMVINIGKALGGDWDYVAKEIRILNEAVLSGGAILKVIFETDYLEESHIIKLCELCSAAKPAFVKTSTGYGFVQQPNGYYSYKGATDYHLALIRKHCAPEVQVKAAGGLRTLEDVLRVRALGVTRIGASATEAILQEAIDRGYPRE